MSLERRLGRLEMLWPKPDTTAKAKREAADWRYLSTPSIYWCLLEAVEDRTYRRLLASGGSRHAGWVNWMHWNADEWRERGGRELGELDTRIADLGQHAGLETWVRESLAIAPKYEGETDDRIWREFQHSLGCARRSLDHARAKHPTWAAEHPAWRPDMPFEEFLVFEWELLDRVPELWANVAASQ